MSTLTVPMGKVVEILSPLDSDERKRVVQAAFALLGETAPAGSSSKAASPGSGGTDLSDVAPAAAAWLAKVKITREQLEHNLHFDGGKVRVIGLPGRATKRIDQVVNAYLMSGLASFLATGDASFTDQDARSLCEDQGCYDPTNHAKYIKEFGNRITGSKRSGWKLTTPGLTAAAELFKA